MDNKPNKFYKFKNQNNDSVDVYVYGDIIPGGDKWDSTDVTITDFKQQLDSLGNAKTLNMYISSCGGDVLTTQAMISNLKRCKDSGVTINAYLDGTCASCASWLPMVANNIYAYKNSILMIHKPMALAFGNANDMQKQIDVLDTMENNVMIPLYMEKAKDSLTEDKLKDLLSDETWLDSKHMTDYFNITVLDEEKVMVASTNTELLNKYRNTPKFLLDKIKNKVVEETKEPEKTKIDDYIEENTNMDIELLKISMDLRK